MQYKSIIEARGSVSFPDYTGERVYMEPFFQEDGLPPHLTRWKPTVDSMLEGISTEQPIFLMIDQSPVVKGQTHRRAGVHIDGYWVEEIRAWGGGGGGWNPLPTRHRSTPRHQSIPRHRSGSMSWSDASFEEPEAIILASSLSAARGFTGDYVGVIGDMGDCSQIDLSNLTILPMQQNTVYAGNVCCLHESLPVDHDAVRTLVRLNVPGWTP